MPGRQAGFPATPIRIIFRGRECDFLRNFHHLFLKRDPVSGSKIELHTTGANQISDHEHLAAQVVAIFKFNLGIVINEFIRLRIRFFLQ